MRRSTFLIAISMLALVLCFLVLSRPGTAESANPAVQPFANSTEQRGEMIEQLKEMNRLLREQNELLRGGKLHVVIDRDTP